MLNNSIRPPAVAGTWYPGTPAALTRDVDGYIAAVAQLAVPRGSLDAIIAPHAGLMFSGPVGAHAYKAAAVAGPFEALVLVGPSHFVAFDGVALYPSGAFDSPLGPAIVDEPLAQELLAASPLIQPLPAAHKREHSLEMQLPFVRRLLPEATIVPLLMGYQARDTIQGLADVLARVGTGRRVLLVASTDLSHYFDAPRRRAGPARPGFGPAFDPERCCGSSRNTRKGAGPVRRLRRRSDDRRHARGARGARHGRVLAHPGKSPATTAGSSDWPAPWERLPMFTEAQQRALVGIARAAVTGTVTASTHRCRCPAPSRRRAARSSP
jgi:AmmeMemoRadiSam system protein B